jgi:cytoskeletal protein RodZ
MTRNTKIALGCGGAGCLGLIVVVIAAAILIVTGVVKAPGIYSPNSNSNYNSNYNYNSNSNSNSNDSPNTNSESPSSSSSMSDDDKHRLLLAASLANDPEMMQRVIRKLGFVTASGVSPDYAQFVKEHAEWAMRNREFINSVNTPEKARAYLEEHIDD